MSISEPMELFRYAMKSDATKDRYTRRLKNFFDFLGYKGDVGEQAKQFMTHAKKNGNTWVTANVMKFLSFHKERAERGEIAEGTLRNYYKPVKLFLEMNDIELSWRKITRGLPKGRKHAADRAPTIPEIQKLVEYPDRRIKAIVFTMCSCGIRLGAWDYLKWSHITPIIENDTVLAAKIRVYANDAEEYFSFITPEAYHELKKWMDFRAESGETIIGESWLMRDLWNVEKFAKGLLTVPKQLKSLGIKRLMERALKAQGIRKELQPGQKRHEFQADHGLRKFFKTHSEQSMKPINVEILMGHSTGISDSYYQPNEILVLLDTTGIGDLRTVSISGNISCDFSLGPNDGFGNDTPDLPIFAGILNNTLQILDTAPDDLGISGISGTCTFHDTVTATESGPFLNTVFLNNTSTSPITIDDEFTITIRGTFQ